MKSKLETEFFPIAKTGRFPQGDLTEDIFDQIVNSFNAANYEPPVTLGHIRDNHGDKPAMAWIAEVKRVGDTLFAKARQVWGAFDNMVREGRYKKRSIGIRVNESGSFYLHHLAFLGSMPPAVSGMPDIYSNVKYSEADATTQKDEFIFEENTKSKTQKGVEKVKEYTEAEIREIEQNAAAAAKTAAEEKAAADYEAKLIAEKEAAEKAGREAAAAEYAAKEAAEKARIAHESKVNEFCDQGIKDGFITPAMIKAGLKSYLYSLKENTEMNFSEIDADGKEVAKKAGSFDLVKNILKQYAAAPAGNTEDPAGAGNQDGEDYAAEKKKAAEYAEKNGVSYSQALKAVRAESKK